MTSRAGRAVDHEPAQAGHQEGEERGVAPLARARPRPARSRAIMATMPKFVGLNRCLPRKRSTNLLAIVDDRRQRGERQRVGAQQQAEREPRDERAPRVEGRQPPAGGCRRAGRGGRSRASRPPGRGAPRGRARGCRRRGARRGPGSGSAGGPGGGGRGRVASGLLGLCPDWTPPRAKRKPPGQRPAAPGRKNRADRHIRERFS